MKGRLSPDHQGLGQLLVWIDAIAFLTGLFLPLETRENLLTRSRPLTMQVVLMLTRAKLSMPHPLSEVCHLFPEPLVGAHLIRRYKRFLADVKLPDGRSVTVHCPNSGSMLGCLTEGAPVYCSPCRNSQRKTAYTWEMIYIGQQWVGINTGVPNELVAKAAKARTLPLFRQVSEVRREVRVGAHTRLDMVLEQPNQPLYVEVKNVTLVRSGEAHFPDAVTNRGAKHLEVLMELVRQGNAAAMIYVVQRQDAEVFGPAEDIDPNYARLYRQARTKGVQIVALEAKVTPEGICLARQLPLQ